MDIAYSIFSERKKVFISTFKVLTSNRIKKAKVQGIKYFNHITQVSFTGKKPNESV